jgi:hypothetical protein
MHLRVIIPRIIVLTYWMGVQNIHCELNSYIQVYIVAVSELGPDNMRIQRGTPIIHAHPPDSMSDCIVVGTLT